MPSERESKTIISFSSVASILTAILLMSCDQPFDPRGALDKKLVVFSILSTDREMQFVRVEHDYMPEGLDGLADTSSKSIADAEVQLHQGNVIQTL